jgi:hypothetical protein
MTNYRNENNKVFMGRYRISRDTYKILSIEAIRRGVKPTVFMNDILTSVATKIKTRNVESNEFD